MGQKRFRVARACGLLAGVGTFGINHMLITETGCCGRGGSVVTDMELDPTPMLQEELCLFRRDGSCGACAKRPHLPFRIP